MSVPTYRGMTADDLPGGWLRDALDGLYAYDSGSVDSGVKDEELRAFVRAIIRSWSEETVRYRLSVMMYELCLSPEALAQGYGWEDAMQLGQWFDNDFRPL